MARPAPGPRVSDDTGYRSPRQQLEDLPLFLPARRTDPATSHQAARDAEESGRAGSIRERIVAFALEAGEYGVTRSEIDRALGTLIQSSSPCIGQLKGAGILVSTGRTRMGPFGARQEVLVHHTFAKKAG